MRGARKSEGMTLRIVIGGVRSKQMTNPPEQAARPNPESGCDDQPEDTTPNPAVVDLSYARNDQTQNCRCARIPHDAPCTLHDAMYESIVIKVRVHFGVR